MMKNAGIGSISGRIQSESALLSELNDSLLTLEIDALGRGDDFDVSAEDIARSKESIHDFAARLMEALDQSTPSVDISPIVVHLSSGMKPLSDWIEDLDTLTKEISTGHVSIGSVQIIEELISLLDDQFSDDLRRLFCT